MNPKIESLMDDFVRDNPGFARMEKEGAFSALCAKYMFFSNPMLTPFTEEQFACCIPDGSRDGGIDAMFADPDPEMKRVVVFQCKYYSEGNLQDVVQVIPCLSKGTRKDHSTLQLLQARRQFPYVCDG